ncbi:MAG: sigma-54-dependent Fis family transcriptional regulator [Deltaproteobacteria bacterium]|nr:sigma-54-dependent Fis family transcriptional regulator [Deltaproteobacteria bacterium]
MGRVLVVEDDEAMAATLVRGLGREGFAVEVARSGEESLARLAESDWDALLTDLAMGGMDGLELCERAISIQPGLPVVVMTAFGSLETAIQAIRAGAYDFLTKPFDLEVAALALGRAVAFRRLRSQLQRLERARERSSGFEELVGDSPPMRELLALLERVADSDVTVLIAGESGVGKELVARTLHRTSRRAGGPFVAINCAALPAALLESELFGHTRGAFTDARSARPGLFVQASGGTLFLDEVGEMPVSVQAKLLRALQDRSVRPVGSDHEVPVDARIVAATNRDLDLAVKEGEMREDLYFRLAVLEVHVPPLRERRSDIVPLLRRSVERETATSGKAVTGFSPEAMDCLLAYPWPGNVRELQNCVQRAVAVARFEQIVVDDLPERIRISRRSATAGQAAAVELVPLEEVERRHVLGVLAAVGGRRKEAARVLGLDRKTLYRKLRSWGSDGPE